MYSLVVAPLLFALVAYLIPRSRWGRWWRPYLIPIAGATQCCLLVHFWRSQSVTYKEGWLALDPLNYVLLPAITVLFTICSLYAPTYLHLRPDKRNRVFCACLTALLGVMSLVMLTHHLGLMWVAVEATSLVTAPLIYFNRTPLSIEAAWKYLLVGSVGIALALLGSFFLAYAAMTLQDGVFSSTLLLEDLFSGAPELSRPWLKMAFATLLVGYGTKMGLAPLHSWKPDAYGEAPGIVGALLAGGVTSCAFVAVVRFTSVMHAAGEFAFASRLLIGIGIFSVGFSALFQIRQRDFKRLLAYSSIEHMGILVLGIGIGGLGCFAAIFHVINNAFAKGILFIASGNIHRAYKSKSVDYVHGALQRTPWSAGFLLVGLFAITGSPPFSPFISIFSLIQSMLNAKHLMLAFGFIAILLVAFMGMAHSFLSLLQGEVPQESWKSPYRDGVWTILPLALLTVIIIVMGVYLPPVFEGALQGAVKYVEAGL